LYTENVAFAVVGNIQLARQVAGAHGGRIIITGGGSANHRFGAIVASLANAEVVVTEEADTTMIGAAASCEFGSKGVLPGMAEKLSKLRNRTMHVTPASDAKTCLSDMNMDFVLQRTTTNPQKEDKMKPRRVPLAELHPPSRNG